MNLKVRHEPDASHLNGSSAMFMKTEEKLIAIVGVTGWSLPRSARSGGMIRSKVICQRGSRAASHLCSVPQLKALIIEKELRFAAVKSWGCRSWECLGFKPCMRNVLINCAKDKSVLCAMRLKECDVGRYWFRGWHSLFNWLSIRNQKLFCRSGGWIEANPPRLVAT